MVAVEVTCVVTVVGAPEVLGLQQSISHDQRQRCVSSFDWSALRHIVSYRV
jgi:hypothetical protein